MAIITFTKEDLYGGPLDHERHELMLFRGELVEEGRFTVVQNVVPLIDKRLREIEEDRLRYGLSPSDPVRYADTLRECEEEMAVLAADRKRDEEGRI